MNEKVVIDTPISIKEEIINPSSVYSLFDSDEFKNVIKEWAIAINKKMTPIFSHNGIMYSKKHIARNMWNDIRRNPIVPKKFRKIYKGE